MLAIVILLYYLAALAFAAFMQWSDRFGMMHPINPAHPLWSFWAATVGRASALFVMSGLIPAIILLVGRFRPSERRRAYRKAALYLWLVLGIGTALAMNGGYQFELDQKIEAELGDNTVSSEGQAEMIRDMKISCIGSQKQNLVNRQGGATDQLIRDYCECYAAEVVKVMTMEELRHIARNGQVPTTLKDKIDAAGATCGRTVMFKGH
jgi:hypothetical protein